MTRLLKGIALTAVLAGFTSAASAALLQNLIAPGATLQQGDLIFGNFTWTGPSGPAGFTVTGIGNGTPANYYGVELSGPFIQPILGASDWSFSYSVTVAPGFSSHITGIQQSAAFVGDSMSIINISEDALNAPGGVVVGSSHLGQGLFNSSVDYSDPPAELGDQLAFANPLSTVWIKKDILLAVVGPGMAQVYSIDQRYTQPVPEPATLVSGMAAFGLMLVSLCSRRGSPTRIGQ